MEKQLLEIVRETLLRRKKNNVVRNDFLDVVSHQFKSTNENENELDVTAQAATFFGEGYETISRVHIFQTVNKISVTCFKRKKDQHICLNSFMWYREYQ